MDVNKDMVEYWYGGDIILPKDVINDIVDLANGKYKVKTLTDDILSTWEINHANIKER